MTGFPEFGQFCSFGFPEGTQFAQVPCVYLFRHARITANLAIKGATAKAKVNGEDSACFR
jgi:hypothetical protein